MSYLYFLLLCMFTKKQKYTCKAKTKISACLITDLGWYKQQGCHWQFSGWLLSLQKQLSWLEPSPLPLHHGYVHATAFGCFSRKRHDGSAKNRAIRKQTCKISLLWLSVDVKHTKLPHILYIKVPTNFYWRWLSWLLSLASDNNENFLTCLGEYHLTFL